MVSGLVRNEELDSLLKAKVKVVSGLVRSQELDRLLRIKWTCKGSVLKGFKEAIFDLESKRMKKRQRSNGNGNGKMVKWYNGNCWRPLTIA